MNRSSRIVVPALVIMSNLALSRFPIYAITEVLDQQHDVLTTSGMSVGNAYLVQFFDVGTKGILSHVDVKITSLPTSPTSTSIRIIPRPDDLPLPDPFDPADVLAEGTIQIDIPPSSTLEQWYSLDLSSDLLLVSSGDRLGLGIYSSGLNFPFDPNNGYPGGIVGYKAPGFQWQFFGSRDLLFRTYVYLIPPGDFDNDLDVDSTDLAIWESSYAIDGGADGNDDGVSSGEDFLYWQQNLGTVAPPPTVSATVPEPSAMLLGAWGCAGMLMWRKRIRCIATT